MPINSTWQGTVTCMYTYAYMPIRPPACIYKKLILLAEFTLEFSVANNFHLWSLCLGRSQTGWKLNWLDKFKKSCTLLQLVSGIIFSEANTYTECTWDGIGAYLDWIHYTDTRSKNHLN